MQPTSAATLKTAILLVDIQSAFLVPDYFGTERNNTSLEANVQKLLDASKRWNSEKSNRDKTKSIEIIHVHHHSTNPESVLHPSYILPAQLAGPADDSPPNASVRGIDPLPCASVAQDEAVFTKGVNSAFIGTLLEQHLRQRQVRQLVICGITTDHCVSTTVRMAANLKVVDDLHGSQTGRIFVLDDACATFGKGDFPADLVHKVHIESLKGEFAEIIETQDFIDSALT